MVVEVLERSTPVPLPHPGFCLFDKFSLSSSSIFDFIERAIFPTSSTSFSIRCLIAFMAGALVTAFDSSCAFWSFLRSLSSFSFCLSIS
uniref:Uncharacterized protein n=1 Tax=Rhizophora mucronata TaxID=61149 RepID=A0A2P2M1V4_RHIMU